MSPPGKNHKHKLAKVFTLKVDKKMRQYKAPRTLGRENPNLFNSISEHLKFELSKLLGMTLYQINNNSESFSAYVQLFGEDRLLAFIRKKKGDKHYLNKSEKNRLGWLINAIKSETRQEQERIDRENEKVKGIIPDDLDDIMNMLVSNMGNKKESDNTS